MNNPFLKRYHLAVMQRLRCQGMEKQALDAWQHYYLLAYKYLNLVEEIRDKRIVCLGRRA